MNDPNNDGHKILMRIFSALDENEAKIFARYLFKTEYKLYGKSLYEHIFKDATSENFSLSIGLKYIIVPTDYAMNILEQEYFKEDFEEQKEFWQLVLGHVISQVERQIDGRVTREAYYGSNGYKYIGEELKNQDEHKPEIGDTIETLEIVKVIDVSVKGLAKPKIMHGYTTHRESIRILFIDGFLIPHKFDKDALKKVFK